MRHLVVPGTAIRISRIGFGCARLNAGGELKATTKVIETALECGIRHFDTAPSYGSGSSEEALGQVLSGVKDVTIATKVGLRIVGGPQKKPTGSLYRQLLRPLLAQAPGVKAELLALRTRMRRAARPSPPLKRRAILADEITASLEQSLKRLRRTQVDLLLLHEPEQLEWPMDTVAALENHVKFGTIRGFGLAFASPDDGRVLGGVTQAHFEPASPHYVSPDRVHLVHSVLRTAPGSKDKRSASQRVAAALSLGAGVGVVFSASSSAQIRDIINGPAGAACVDGKGLS